MHCNANTKQLDVLLGVVPSTTDVVQKQGHHNASHRTKHEVAGKDLSSEQRLALVLANLHVHQTS